MTLSIYSLFSSSTVGLIYWSDGGNFTVNLRTRAAKIKKHFTPIEIRDTFIYKVISTH